MVVSVCAWAACGRTAIGARAMKAPRPIATYLLIIAVSFEASASTFVCRTSSLCGFHAELKMNAGFNGCSSRADAQRPRSSRPHAGADRSRAESKHAQVRLPPHFCELRVRGREHHAAIRHFAIAHRE